MRQVLRIMLVCLSAMVFTVPGAGAASPFDAEHAGFAAYVRGAHVFEGKNIYERLIDGRGEYPVAGVEIWHDTAASDGSWWADAYGLPSFGFGFSTGFMSSLPFKNDSALGNVYNLYGHARFSFVRTDSFRFGPVVEFGPSLTARRYDALTNPHNKYVGSNLFFLIGGGLEASFRMGKHWSAGVDAMLFHHSNGMMTIPNWGLNEASVGVFVKYSPSAESGLRRSGPAPERPDFRKWNFDIYASGGAQNFEAEWLAYNSIVPDPADKKSRFAPHPAAVLGFDAVCRYHPVFATGVVADVFYTSGVDALRECDSRLHLAEASGQKYSPISLGFGLIQEFYYARFALHMEAGVYAFRRVGIEDDISSFYQRVGFRYYLPFRMFLGFDMRAHKIDRSHCLEFTLGVRL